MTNKLTRLIAITLSTISFAVLSESPVTAAPSAERAYSSIAPPVDKAASAPGTKAVGNRVYYPDGTVFVAVTAGTLSISQCSAGQFCIWTQANYSGSFTYKTGSGVTRTISGTVGSFWNNRSTAARLYSNTGASSTCYENGVQESSVSSSYNSASKVYLSASANC